MKRTRSFDRIARGVVASTLAATGGGCVGVDVDGMDPIACTKDERFDAFGDVKLSEAFDSLDLVQLATYGGEPTVVASTGARCATATDAAACQATVDAFLAPVEDEAASGDLSEGFALSQCVDFCESYAVLATVGDEVREIRDAAGVKALLGPIDTPTEAVWIVGLGGYFAGCGDVERWGTREAGGGWEVAATKITASCDPYETTQFLLGVKEEGGGLTVLDESVLESESGVCAGRRPACAGAIVGRGRTHLGAHLASLAQLEAASIPAFAELARELGALGAPRSLVRRARRARAEEVRHALVMKRLAQRHGGSPARPAVTRIAPRALCDVAIANAREGCVREAFGAVVGRWQAERAADPELRREMGRIARDEAAHAALALRVDAWARRRLSLRDRQRVAGSREQALAELRSEIEAAETHPSLVEALGLPTRAQALALLDGFAEALAAPERQHQLTLPASCQDIPV